MCIYQEAERLAQRQAFRTTVSNYIARLAVSASFALLFVALPAWLGVYICLLWGFSLLSGLSYLLARARRVGRVSEMLKHAGIAVIVIALSKAIGLAVKFMLPPA